MAEIVNVPDYTLTSSALDQSWISYMKTNKQKKELEKKKKFSILFDPFPMTTQEKHLELPQEPWLQVCLPLVVSLKLQRQSCSKTNPRLFQNVDFEQYGS